MTVLVAPEIITMAEAALTKILKADYFPEYTSGIKEALWYCISSDNGALRITFNTCYIIKLCCWVCINIYGLHEYDNVYLVFGRIINDMISHKIYDRSVN